MSNRCAWNYVLTPVRGHQCIFSFCFLGTTDYSDSLQFVRVCWQRSPPGLFHLPWAPWYPTRYRGFEDPFRSGLSRGLQFRKWHSDSDGPPSAPKDTPADPPFSGLWPLPLRLVCLGYPRAPGATPPHTLFQCGGVLAAIPGLKCHRAWAEWPHHCCPRIPPGVSHGYRLVRSDRQVPPAPHPPGSSPSAPRVDSHSPCIVAALQSV